MVEYCVKRLLQSVVSMFIVVSIVFLLLRLMPIEGFFPDGQWIKMSWEAKLAVLQKLGLYGADKEPIHPLVQLFNYFKSIATNLSFGESTQMYPGKQVMGIIADKMPLSMSFSMIAYFASLFLGFVLGISMARYKNSILDGTGTAYIVFVSSIPPLVYYFIVQYFVTKWLGASMIYRAGQVNTYIAPIICIMLSPIATNALWIRRYMVDEFNKDYVKLAYAKGMPSHTVMYRHVLRNAFTPMAYTIPVALVATLSGSLVMERLFSVPGMGRLLTDAINKRDNNFVQTLVFIYSSLGILGVFVGDIFAVLVDPRIKLTVKEGTR